MMVSGIRSISLHPRRIKVIILTLWDRMLQGHAARIGQDYMDLPKGVDDRSSYSTSVVVRMKCGEQKMIVPLI